MPASRRVWDDTVKELKKRQLKLEFDSLHSQSIRTRKEQGWERVEYLLQSLFDSFLSNHAERERRFSPRKKESQKDADGEGARKVSVVTNTSL